MSRALRERQRGATLILVIFMLAAMLLGGLMLARLSAVDTLVAGNVARNDASTLASDVGIASAFDDLKALAGGDANAGGWYFATPVGDDTTGLPAGVDWTVAREVQVGLHSVRYVVERQCSSPVVTDPLNECLLRENKLDIRNAGGESVAPPALRTYRVTVRVTGPKSSVTWIQALLSWK